MHNTSSDTFCPAKWQELVVNMGHQFVYGCCKSTPIDFCKDNINDLPAMLSKEKENLLNGVKDSSCDYCWDVEKNGGQSLRHRKLVEWNGNLDIELLELNVGNLCNLSCSYCNPSFSSKWAKDIRTETYPIFTDKGHYGLTSTLQRDYNVSDMVELFRLINPTKMVRFIGGETLINKKVIKLINELEFNNFHIKIATNMCFYENVHDTIAKLAKNNHVWFGASLDCYNSNISSFIRYGLDWDLWQKNLDFILKNTDATVEILTLLTAHTIWDLDNLYNYILELHEQYPGRIDWDVSFCNSPKINSFNVLNPKEQQQASELLESVISKNIFGDVGLEIVLGNLKQCKFKRIIRKEQSEFIKEFAKRRNTLIPKELEFLI